MWVFDTGKIEWLQKGKTKYKFRLLGNAFDATFSLYRIKQDEWMIQREETAENLLIYKHHIQPMLCDAAQAIPAKKDEYCLLYTSPSPRDATLSRMPSSA